VAALLFSLGQFFGIAVRLQANTLSWSRMVILQKRVAGLTEDSLDRFVARAKRATGLRGSVTVLVTSSRELRRLNHRFRGKDKPTDVLSFPPERHAARGFAGDLAISAEIAVQNARRLGHSPAEEIRILVLHGVLHLAGYDHETDNGKMARREEQLRKQLGMPMALIERSDARKAQSRDRRAMPQRTPGNATQARPYRSSRRSRRRAP
jgi:probable rRNA maturation factor